VALADVDGTFLYYRTVGSGPPCLVMHGGLGIDHNAYSPGLDGLGQGIELVYYDHRCHGRSGRPDPATISLARLADDADQLRQAVAHDRIGVLGHSFGGFVGFEYAVRHAANLAFLIVVCSSPTVDYMAEIPDLLEARMTPAMRAELALPPPTTSEEWARRTALLPLYFLDHRPAYDVVLNGRVLHNLDGARCSDLDGWERWEELAHVDVPTLLIAGRHDWIPHLSRLERLAGVMPAAELVVFERSGHYPWLEEPDGFDRTVLEWVGGLPTPQRSEPRAR
jgi:proline iminopeptidase